MDHSLKEKSLPGHQRCVILYLVVLQYRICSARNVHAQQHDWGREAALASVTPLTPKLPQGLVDLIVRKTDSWPIGLSEAVKYKEESEKERDLAMKAQTQRIGVHNFETPMVNQES